MCHIKKAAFLAYASLALFFSFHDPGRIQLQRVVSLLKEGKKKWAVFFYFVLLGNSNEIPSINMNYKEHSSCKLHRTNYSFLIDAVQEVLINLHPTESRFLFLRRK